MKQYRLVLTDMKGTQVEAFTLLCDFPGQVRQRLQSSMGHVGVLVPHTFEVDGKQASCDVCGYSLRHLVHRKEG